MKKSLITEFRIDLNRLPILAQTGVVIVVICFLLALKERKNVQVKKTRYVCKFYQPLDTECGVTCHTKCQHFIPDFCGLSMEMANQMLAEIKAANKRKTLEATVTPSSSSTTNKPKRASNEPPVDDLSQLSLNQQKPLPQQPPTPSAQQRPPTTPSHTVGRPQQPPALPVHAPVYPLQTNDPRYHQGRPGGGSPQMRPMYVQQPSPQMDLMAKVKKKKWIA